MTDMLSTLVWVLASGTGLQVYTAPKPLTATTPCLTVQMISDPIQDSNHNKGGALHNSRVQIGHIGDYETIRPYVETVRAILEGNKTDFASCISDGVYIETYETDNLWSLVRGYFIQWHN